MDAVRGLASKEASVHGLAIWALRGMRVQDGCRDDLRICILGFSATYVRCAFGFDGLCGSQCVFGIRS